MRKSILLFLILYLFNSSPASADCMGRGIWVMMPVGESIAPNSVFVVELHGSSSTLITETGPTKLIYLITSAEKKVSLTVSEVFIGDDHTTQVLLKPEGLLQSGEIYFIQTDSSLTERLGQSYKVDRENDFDKPEWINAPENIGTVFHPFACGIESHVDFCCCVRDASECMIIASVRNLFTGKQQQAFLSLDSTGRVALGREMCGGMFDLADTSKYQAEFRLMDASGNKTGFRPEHHTFLGPMAGENTSRTCSCYGSADSTVANHGNGKGKFELWMIIYIAGIAFVVVVIMEFVRRSQRNRERDYPK